LLKNKTLHQRLFVNLHRLCLESLFGLGPWEQGPVSLLGSLGLISFCTSIVFLCTSIVWVKDQFGLCCCHRPHVIVAPLLWRHPCSCVVSWMYSGYKICSEFSNLEEILENFPIILKGMLECEVTIVWCEKLTYL